jgi:hypothetical protein
MDHQSILDLQNRANKNRWYQVDKISDRELIIRFPKDDETSIRLLNGTFRFVLMHADVFDQVWEERKSGIFTGLWMGLMLGLVMGFAFGVLYTI